MGGLSSAKLVILKSNTKLMRMILYCMLNNLYFLTANNLDISKFEVYGSDFEYNQKPHQPLMLLKRHFV